MSPGAAQAESLTIQVTSIVVKVDSIDKRPKGASKGDRIVYRDRLLNTVRQFGKARGTHVGTDRGTMTFTSANTARFDGSATLPGGTVRIKGPCHPRRRRRHPDPGRGRHRPLRRRQGHAHGRAGRQAGAERLPADPARQRRLSGPGAFDANTSVGHNALVIRRVSFVLVLLLAVSLVPAASGGTQAKKLTFSIMSRMQVTQPHDIAPKGRENKGDYIKYKALLLTVGPLFGKQKKNVAVGYEEGTQTYLNADRRAGAGQDDVPGAGHDQLPGRDEVAAQRDDHASRSSAAPASSPAPTAS